MSVLDTLATTGLAKALREASRLSGPVAIEVLAGRSGVVYFSDGRVTCVETSGIPDLRTRLVRSGSVRGARGRAEIRTAGSLPEAIRLLICDGDLEVADVEATARSVIVDGAQSLLQQSGHEAADVRIHPGVLPVAGSGHRFEIDSVIRAADERIMLCARLGIDPDLSLQLRPVTRPVTVLYEHQWAFVTKIDGRLTSRDLAWWRGAELFATLSQVADLVRVGLCRVLSQRPGALTFQPIMLPAPTPVRPAPDPPEPAPETGATVAQRLGTPPEGMLRLTGTVPAEWVDDLTADVDVDADVIQRLITGLRAMD